MNTKLMLYACSMALLVPASAEFRTWTRGDGKTAELELLSTRPGEAGDVIGTFKMRNGAKVDLPASSLVEADGKLVKDWQPAAATDNPSTAQGKASVFDDVLEGNLVKLDGKRLKACKDFTKPAKYYLFYYTASWCGPCQRFTPELVTFYQSNKNANFEVVLITSDDDEDAMEQYARDKQMPWPQLKQSKAKSFKSKFQHGVRGIPSVVACDLQGNIVAKTNSIPQLTELIK